MQTKAGIAASCALQAVGVGKAYGAITVLDDVSVHVAAGEIVALLGPNGAGKSTFLRVCEGREKIDAGRISLFGRDLAVEPDVGRGDTGLVLQRPTFSGYATVQETVDMFTVLNPPRINPAALIGHFGLTAKATTRISKLSGGERQRLAVLVGLMGANRLILLDEPTSELDPQARRLVWRLIARVARELGSAILMTTHQMEEAALLCDRVYVIDHGRVIAHGTPSELILAHSRTVEVTVTLSDRFEESVLEAFPDIEASRNGQYLACCLRVASEPAGREVMRRLLDGYGDGIVDIGLKRASLEDVFISLTGEHLRD